MQRPSLFLPLAWTVAGCFLDAPPADSSEDSASTGTADGTVGDGTSTVGPTSSATMGSTTSAEGSASDGVGSGNCPGLTQCLPAPPPPGGGWVGPMALALGADGDPQATCPNGWLSEAETWLVEEPDYSCSCGCGAVSGECAVAVTEHSDDTCISDVATTQVSAPVCTAVTMPGNTDHYLSVANPVLSNAQCAPIEGPGPPPLMMRPATLCDPPATGETCDAGVCVAVGPGGFGRMCIVSADESKDACPPMSPYSQRFETYGVVNDTRECPACSCPVIDAACTGILTAYQAPTCLFSSQLLLFDVVCQLVGFGTTGPVHAELSNVQLMGTCDPQPSASPRPTGGVELEGARVVCCLPG